MASCAGGCPAARFCRWLELDETAAYDVTVHERDGRYMATADLAEDSRDVGVGDTPQEAVKAALKALGEPYAGELAEAGARSH